jgi:hypothetical protein
VFQLPQVALELFNLPSTLVDTMGADLICGTLDVGPNKPHLFQNFHLLIENNADDGKLFPHLLDAIKCLSSRLSPNFVPLLRLHISFVPA